MAEYKEMLREKARKLRSLLARAKDRMEYGEYTRMMVLVDNTIIITDGRLDGFDYQQRDKTIREYHSQLDTSIGRVNRTLSNQQGQNR